MPVLRNMIPNPNLVGSGTVEVRRNIGPNSAFATSVSGWGVTAGFTTVTHVPGGGAQIDVVAAGAAHSNLLYQSSVVATAPGDERSGAMQVSVPAGFPAVSLYLTTYEYGANVAMSPIVGIAVTVQPGETRVLYAVSTMAAPPGATGVRTLLRAGSTIAPGARVLVRMASTEPARVPGAPFSGGLQTVPDADLVASWVGAPNASDAILSGVPVSGAVTAGQGCVAIRSGRVSPAGGATLRIIRTSVGANPYVRITGETQYPSETATISVFRDTAASLASALAVFDSALATKFFTLGNSSDLAPPGEWKHLRATGDTTGWLVQSNIVLRPPSVVGESLWYAMPGLFAGAYDGEWFTGNSPGASWEGTAENSVSRWVRTYPALTPHVDDAPCPRVEVFFDALKAGTATLTMWRLASGRTEEVRGAIRAQTGGALARIDFEAPFNVPITYRAEMFNAAGQSLGFTESADVTLPVSDTWMHNPLSPQGAVRVQFGGDTASTISRPVPGVVSRPLGRRVGVVLSEPRQGVMGLPLDVRTTSDADADRVQALIGGYDETTVPVVCLRLGGTQQRMRVPQPLFLAVMNPTETDITYQLRGDGGEISHRFDGDEVAPPIPGLFIPLLTRADLNAFYATRAALNADNLRRVDVDRRYDLAGAAG